MRRKPPATPATSDESTNDPAAPRRSRELLHAIALTGAALGSAALSMAYPETATPIAVATAVVGLFLGKRGRP